MAKRRVLMTGFGDFQNVKDNLSWQGVEAMDRDRIEGTYDIHFYKEQIDVTYKTVEKNVPKLWAKLQPDLTIHVGVGDLNTSCFQLETQANKESYQIPDNESSCPPDFKHFADGPDTIATDLDVDQVREAFNNMEPALEGLTAVTSHNAGLFVCEYIYYTSLTCRGTSKTLFVHVPCTGFSKEQIAEGLERIMQICLKQMEGC